MAANKPERRKSTLAAQQPYAPPVVDETPAPAPAAAAEPVVSDAPAPAVKPAPKPAKKPKVSFYQDPEDTARARAAMLNTQGQEGTVGWSDFVAKAVMEKAERLEQRYNAGKPWPPLAAGEIPRGRPMGV